MANPTPKVDITLLPNELLDQVLDHLANPRGLVHLRKAHRHFESCTRRLILKDVVLSINPELEGDVRIFEDFLKAVETDPTILTLVRSLKFRYRWGNRALGESRRVKEKLLHQLLALITGAVDAVVEFVGGGSARLIDEEYMLLLRDMLADSRLPLTVQSTYPHPVVMSNIATLPTVRSLFLLGKRPVPRGDIGLANLRPEISIHAIPPPVTGYLLICYAHMQTLDFTNFTLDCSHLNPLVRAFPNLGSLRACTTAPFAVVPRLLSPLKSSLKTPDLASPPGCELPQHNFQPADFSTYTNLHTLRLPESAFFPPAPCDHTNNPVPNLVDAGFIWRLPHQRTGLHKLLPPQLSSLSLLFNWPNMVFARGYAYHCQFKVLPV